MDEYPITMDQLYEVSKESTGVYYTHIMQVLSMMGYTGTPIGQLHNELFRAGGPHKFPYRYMDAKTVTDLLHPAEALSCLHILGSIKLTM